MQDIVIKLCKGDSLIKTQISPWFFIVSSLWKQALGFQNKRLLTSPSFCPWTIGHLSKAQFLSRTFAKAWRVKDQKNNIQDYSTIFTWQIKSSTVNEIFFWLPFRTMYLNRNIVALNVFSYMLTSTSGSGTSSSDERYC